MLHQGYWVVSVSWLVCWSVHYVHQFMCFRFACLNELLHHCSCPPTNLVFTHVLSMSHILVCPSVGLFIVQTFLSFFFCTAAPTIVLACPSALLLLPTLNWYCRLSIFSLRQVHDPRKPTWGFLTDLLFMQWWMGTDLNSAQSGLSTEFFVCILKIFCRPS